MKRSSAWLSAFAVIAVVHLVTIGVGDPWAAAVSKVLLMPVLAVWVRLRGGPVTLLVGLAASLVGDFLLEVDHLIPGMAAFGVAHVCYVLLFVRRSPRRSLVVVTAYGVLWVGVLALLWPDLGDVRIPVAAYSLLLIATAVTSAWNGWRPGIGGAVFLVSDALIGVELAGHDFGARPYLVMATYCAAQYLLASSLVAVGQPTEQDLERAA
ncbi:lysoplasmalogenase [Kribbella antibiotica]|uniref:lysoplasmalogenase n=1 Tax=Kribbella antibiotica TaxID=190195 RepID=UPI001404E810|nr:lysoplasmalogenase [Kribbella antibiotica]